MVRNCLFRSHSWARLAAGILLIPALTLAPQAFALESVEVFTDPALFPVALGNSGVAVEVHDLSAQQKLLDELGQGLPGNPSLAKDMAASRLETAGFRQRLADTTTAALLASRYGITKIPAIVFDRGAAVAYGLTDVNQAVQVYQHWKEAQ